MFERCCALLRQRDRRAAELLPLLEAHAGYAPGWRRLAATLLEAGQLDAARVAAQRALDAQPGDAEAHLVLGEIRMRSGDGPGALAAFAAAAQHAPRSPLPPYRTGLLLRQGGDGGGAAAAFVRATALDPGFARAWFAFGLLHQDRGAHDEAADAFRAALEAQPDLHEAALNLGIALQEIRQFEAALDAYARCYSLHPPAFGRIAQAVTAAPVGRLWFDLDDLRATLARRA